MKNFQKLSKKIIKDNHGKNYVTTWLHLPTNNIIFEHQHTYWGHSWRDNENHVGSSQASLKFWVNEFFKHPITLGK